MAQESGPGSIALLIERRDDPTEDTRVRLYAATELLNRGFGKPSQDVTVQMAQANEPPDYFAWLPPERLQLITKWLAEAKAAKRRGEARPGTYAPPPAALLAPPAPGAVIDVEPLGSAAPGHEPEGETGRGKP